MIDITFSEVNEQTPQDVFGSKVNMLATFDHNCLTVTTKGGQEFLVNTRLPIQSIYPLDDGLIIKCKFKNEGHYQQQNLSYCYLTLSGHPLNDLHPLGSNQQILINTSSFEIIWASNEIPFLITWENDSVKFNIICRNFQEESDPLFTDFQQRNTMLNSFAETPTHKLRTVASFKTLQPSKAIVTQGDVAGELCVSLLFAKEKAVYVYKSDNQLNFKLIEKLSNFVAIQDFKFLKFSQGAKLRTTEIRDQFTLYESQELRYFRDCVARLNQEFIILSAEGEKLNVYHGCCNLIHSFSLPVLTGLPQPVTQLSSSGGLIKLQYLSGKQLNVNLCIDVSDFIISSIINLIKQIFSITDRALFLKRFVTHYCSPGGTLFSNFAQNFIDMVCGSVSKQSEGSPLKKSITGSPTKKLQSPTKLLQSSPVKKSQTSSKTSVVKISAFQQMLESRQQQTGKPKFEEKTKRKLVITKQNLLSELLKHMHLMLLDIELTRGAKTEPLRKLLITIAQQVGHQGYISYYLGQELPQNVEEPVCLDRWIKSQMNFEFPVMFEQTRKVVRIYEVMGQIGLRSFFVDIPNKKSQFYFNFQHLLIPNTAPEPIERKTAFQYILLGGTLHLYEKVLLILNEEKLGIEQIQALPYQCQLPLHEILRYSRIHLDKIKTQDWPPSIYRLIEREDIINNMQQTEKPNLIQKLQKKTSQQFQLQRQKTTEFDQKQQETQPDNKFVDDLISSDIAEQKHQNDEAEYVKASHNDTRYQEVQFLLRSDVQMKIPSTLSADLSEEDRIARQKMLLEKMFKRQLSKCIGRGAFSLATEESLPTQKLNIPKICQTAFVSVDLSAQLDESNAPQAPIILTYEIKSREDKDLVQWPEFHNGVASALRIARSNFNQSAIKNARNWIMYHRPQTPKNEHGGFLLGLGLLGQLDTLQPTDVYQHLKTAHDSTTIGILLGRAASKIGKMDESDSRMMCLHIPALLPHTLSVDYSLAVQSAAVVGAGLLYQATSNRQITEMLLSQICKKPSSDKLTEREGYAFASGLALGMVNLGAGRQSKNQSATALLFKELELDQRLIRFVEGGKTMPLPRSMLSQIQLSDNFKSSAIKENEMVNTTITAPGSLVALALIYLKSNDRQIADRIIIPHSFNGLDSITPNILVLKILARNLILWDQVNSSQEWIESQIPETVKFIFESESQSQLNAKLQRRINENDIDFAAIAQCVANIKAASALSIGFKYAGTCDKRAKEVILKVITWFRKKITVVQSVQPLGSNNDKSNLKSFANKNQVDKNTADSSLCICALALSMVMAGSCDIESFRSLRVLRKRFEADMNFGYNQAIFLSFGLLFLSNGQFTLSRSDKAIAGLLSAVYPIFPNSPSDNRHHLQALRHFYVFALETRLLQAKDIDTGSYVNVQVQVQIQTGSEPIESLSLKTPEIINGSIQSIVVQNDPKYHDLNLQVNQEDKMQVDSNTNQGDFMKTDLQQIIYVKRRQVYSNEVKNTELGISFQQMLQYKPTQEELSSAADRALQSLIKVKDPSIQVFMKQFAIESDPSEILTNLLMQDGNDYFAVFDKIEAIIKTNRTQTTQFTLMQLYECFTKDQIGSLPILLSHILRTPLKEIELTPEPLIIKSENDQVQELQDLAGGILEQLVNAGAKDIVSKYRTAVKNGVELTGHLLEIQHAIEMCGFDSRLLDN